MMNFTTLSLSPVSRFQLPFYSTKNVTKNVIVSTGVTLEVHPSAIRLI